MTHNPLLTVTCVFSPWLKSQFYSPAKSSFNENMAAVAWSIVAPWRLVSVANLLMHGTHLFVCCRR